MRVYRVSDVLDASLTEERLQRPADFVLADFWKAWCQEFEQNRPCYPVEDARSRILGWGRAVEVLEPPASRLSIADYAAQVVALYSSEGPRQNKRPPARSGLLFAP
jgi:hypothetical protein